MVCREAAAVVAGIEEESLLFLKKKQKTFTPAPE
jgi:hypothetical protein